MRPAYGLAAPSHSPFATKKEKLIDKDKIKKFKQTFFVFSNFFSHFIIFYQNKTLTIGGLCIGGTPRFTDATKSQKGSVMRKTSLQFDPSRPSNAPTW